MTNGELPSKGSLNKWDCLNEEQWHLVVGREPTQTFESEIQAQVKKRMWCSAEPERFSQVVAPERLDIHPLLCLRRPAAPQIRRTQLILHHNRSGFIYSDSVKSTFPQIFLRLLFALSCTGLVINITAIADVIYDLCSSGLPVSQR